MRKNVNYLSSSCAFLLGMLLLTSYRNANHKITTGTPGNSTNAGLVLPQGFSATIVADSLGGVRHIAVNKNGDIYAKLGSFKNGKGILFLTDANNDGKMDKSIGFGNYRGTGIRIKGNMLYTSSNSAVYRYQLNDKEQVSDTGKAEMIVHGLVDRGRDNAKAIALDDNGHLYVAVGSYDETCADASGKGIPNCPLLDSIGGIWQFSTNKSNQSYADAVHYAKGLKNPVGVDWNEATKSLFATSHGRGSLYAKFPNLYTAQQEQTLPAETFYELHQGADGGWPYVYYDPFLHKKIISPEYGGDAKKSVDDKYLDPIVAFPAHFAPNDLLFYTGNMFPRKYKNGAFIVFHNQSQALKQGFFVAFVPMKNGKASGPWEIFADNFAGVDLKNPSGPPKHRPIGIAQGPDGALYVADDIKGTIYKITYPAGKKRGR